MSDRLQSVHAHIREKFLGVHGDVRTREERIADEEMRRAIEGDNDEISATDIEFIDWEEIDAVDVEVVVDAAEDNPHDVLTDCLFALEQAAPSAPTNNIHAVWEISAPTETADDLIREAMRGLGELT